jgi:hypothetical protein
LTSLDLSRNNICNGNYRSKNRSYDAISALADCLSQDPPLPLLNLNLSENFIDATACRLLAEALATDPPLLVLDLSCNQIAPTDTASEGSIALGKAFLSNHTLLSLSLAGNGSPSEIDYGRSLENVGSQKLPTLLAAVLIKNPHSSLQEIDLRHNRFGRDSSVRGARAAANTAIQRLVQACERRGVFLQYDEC